MQAEVGAKTFTADCKIQLQRCLQIQHAGDGGIYAELIQDRQFGGLAYSLGLFHKDATELSMPASSFECDYLPLSSDVVLHSPSHPISNLTGIRKWRQDASPEYK